MKAPYTEKELQEMPLTYLCNLPPDVAQEVSERYLKEQGISRHVFVLWNNEGADYSDIKGVYATKEAAKVASGGMFLNITRVPFYE